MSAVPGGKGVTKDVPNSGAGKGENYKKRGWKDSLLRNPKRKKGEAEDAREKGGGGLVNNGIHTLTPWKLSLQLRKKKTPQRGGGREAGSLRGGIQSDLVC